MKTNQTAVKMKFTIWKKSRETVVADNRKSSIINHKFQNAFTLIELLVVITTVAILLGLLFPTFRGIQDQAKRTQAKNDLTQIVTAINAFYTEYGKYPLSTSSDTTFGPGGSPTTNETLLSELRGLSATTLNPRQIVFISPPYVKNPANPRSGIATQATNINLISVAIGDLVDPWGTPYNVRIDGNYDNQVANAYTDGSAGGSSTTTPPYALSIGVMAWSFGKDQAIGTRTPPNASFTNSDDVISWQ